jgi:hypothetical protein
MENFYTYQQDTVKAKNLTNSIPQKDELNNVVRHQNPASLINIPQREQISSVPEEKTYTPAQIRNWHIQQENKMLINNTKYLVPYTDFELSVTQEIKPNLVLPLHTYNRTSTDWLTVAIFFGIILFATVRYTYAKYIEHLFLSLINYATSVRMLKEKNYPIFHGAFRLEAIFYITLSIFIFQALNILKWEKALSGIGYFFMILGIVLIYFVAKKLMYFLLGSLFNVTQETREYLFNMDNFNRSLGLFLLPVVILLSYAPFRTPVYMALTGAIIVFVFYIMLLQRVILILLKKQFPMFYLFLYLCTLEFLPLLLIYKVVV